MTNLDLAISVENLSKSYRISTGQLAQPYTALRDVVASQALRAARRLRDAWTGRPLVLEHTTEEFWALSNVSFTVARGEVVGIVGGNGAGKSTLLKIISRITEPTRGRAVVRGRTASLLEVGTGFHPELTGRENVYLNGSILGMRKSEIDRRFAEIVDFAGVEKFLDTPVKRYSSGMYVRLAFAVAAHLEPEILVVDEVLAVGDAEFQRRCLGRMQEVGRSGKTVIFVSHNTTAIRNLCTSAVLLRQGSIECTGDVPTVLARYIGSDTAPETVREWPGEDMPGDAAIRVQRVRVSQDIGQDGVMVGDEPICAEIDLICVSCIPEFDIAILITDAQGVEVIHTSWSVTRAERSVGTGRWQVRYHIPRDTLKMGRYSVSFSGMVPGVSHVFRLPHVVGFEVGPMQSSFAPYSDTSWRGLLSPALGEWAARRTPQEIRGQQARESS